MYVRSTQRCILDALHVPGRSRIHTYKPLFSGHNKWSKIRHSKGAIDADRAKLFSRISNEIAIAAKAGGSDSVSNIRLAAAIASAKKADMPKANIEAAIRRATSGRSIDDTSEATIYEATLGVSGIMIETLSNNKIRTVANLKSILKKSGGSLSPCGFLFDKLGVIEIYAPGQTMEFVEEEAIACGALDVEAKADSAFTFLTNTEDLSQVAKSLAESGYDLRLAEIQFRAKDMLELEGEASSTLHTLLANLESDPDVIRVTTNSNQSE